MVRSRAYRILCAVFGTALVACGIAFLALFVAYHLPASDVPIPTGPTGFYFVAFSGCALVGWGGCLVGAARRSGDGRAAGTATALALALAAAQRLLAWVVGDYFVWPGEALRVEAGVFLALALAFVWLRPPRPAPAAPATGPA